VASEEPFSVLAEGRFIRLVRRGRWEWAERTNTSGAVVVIAVTPDREIVLTEQYRVPVGARVIELPAGLVGDLPETAEEEMAEAARRELLEETGFEADRLELLTEGPTSAGMTNERVAMFLARGARRVAAGGGDASEEIQVHVAPLDEAGAWLEARRRDGTMLDPKIYAALYFARRGLDGLG
jgi:ADP-ribose pyrophosphatase